MFKYFGLACSHTGTACQGRPQRVTGGRHACSARSRSGSLRDSNGTRSPVACKPSSRRWMECTQAPAAVYTSRGLFCLLKITLLFLAFWLVRRQQLQQRRGERQRRERRPILHFLCQLSWCAADPNCGFDTSSADPYRRNKWLASAREFVCRVFEGTRRDRRRVLLQQRRGWRLLH